MAEFDLIARYFTRPTNEAADLGIGDDAALLRVSDGCQLAISADMSVAGTHFFPETPAFDIGWKTMAVNVSDMAAMGALPKWATLSLALPEVDEAWLAQFSRGLFACAERYGVALIGGDTTRGPLNIAINILGEVPVGQALRRDGARVGDDVWVSGPLGSAALWLQARLGKISLSDAEMQGLAPAMHHPQPSVALGLALRGVANSALDLSDGLLADLGHILKASQVGAVLDWARIPRAENLPDTLPLEVLQRAVLAGGDDYALCFTAPVTQRGVIQAMAADLPLPLSLIGSIVAEQGLYVRDGETMLACTATGYNHFGESQP